MMRDNVLDGVFLLMALAGIALMIASKFWDVTSWVPPATLTGVGSAGILLRRGRLTGARKAE